MTTSSPRTLSPTGSPTDPVARLERSIAFARASLSVERFLPALWPALGFAALYLSLGLLGLYGVIAWPAQALLLAATITAIGLGLYSGFENFSWPAWREGARRLEQDSGLVH